ncbi:hypothetical protein CMUS01_09452 [Colletotrichum musicola]|uniref:Extracellular membrane protein CFEM domain-containing protein n=1 Tax=Colletotrichum musicola TaxID=2175873 RepID=A0A8H6K8F9_9PEZI|nr:hypothetical protein CMUS01_09452 [Colletotrichum musicola]
MGESYTGACAAVQVTMESCAKRVDSLRTDCTKSYGSLTNWPGPCECTYYAQDLMCFDEQALCASQVWTQVPEWFRDGVTSCLAKDAEYTIRAELGTFSNPFTVSGLAGSIQRAQTSTAGPGSTSSLPTQTTNPGMGPGQLSGGAIAGIVIGSLAGVSLILGAVYLLWRRRRRLRKTRAGESDDAVFAGVGGKPELDGKPASLAMHEVEGGGVHEMPIKESCQELDAPRTYSELPQSEQHQEPVELSADSGKQRKASLPQANHSLTPEENRGTRSGGG